MSPIMLLFIAVLCVIVGMGLYIYVTMGKTYRMITLVIFGFVDVPLPLGLVS